MRDTSAMMSFDFTYLVDEDDVIFQQRLTAQDEQFLYELDIPTDGYYVYHPARLSYTDFWKFASTSGVDELQELADEHERIGERFTIDQYKRILSLLRSRVDLHARRAIRQELHAMEYHNKENLVPAAYIKTFFQERVYTFEPRAVGREYLDSYEKIVDQWSEPVLFDSEFDGILAYLKPCDVKILRSVGVYADSAPTGKFEDLACLISACTTHRRLPKQLFELCAIAQGLEQTRVRLSGEQYAAVLEHFMNQTRPGPNQRERLCLEAEICDYGKEFPLRAVPAVNIALFFENIMPRAYRRLQREER